MSDYLRQKVLRLPWQATGLPDDEDIGYYYEKTYPEFFQYNAEYRFQIAPTEELFLDFVLESEYGAECGEYGKARELYESEKQRFLPVFQLLLPELSSMEEVRLVEYCWYNGTDAPTYYDPLEDPFLKEVYY